MKFYTTIPLLLAVGLFVTACGGGTSSSSADDNSSSGTVDTIAESEQGTSDSGSDSNDDDGSTGSSSQVSPSGTTIADGARLLASQCYQCHGTDGHSTTDIDSLSGESESELVEEMLEMANENDNDLMHYQARGYTEEQVRAIAAYIASLPGSGSSEDDDSDDSDEEDDDES